MVGHGDLRLTSDETLPELNPGETYRYLGLDQLVEAQKSRTWKRLSEQYLTRVEQVWSSGINSGDKTRTHNMWAVDLLRYYLHAGGRGLTNLLHEWERTILSKVRYWERSNDSMEKGVLELHKDAAAHGTRSSIRVVDDTYRRYSLSKDELVNERGGMRQLAGAQSDGLKELLRRKDLHGAHYKTVQNASPLTNGWKRVN